MPQHHFPRASMSGRLASAAFCLALSALGGVGVAADTAPAIPAEGKRIYAHYMGCWPAGSGPLVFQRQQEWETLRHTVTRDDVAFFGGHVRNYDLIDYATRLTAEQSADLEIRRAMRIGIDGFAIDAWAGGEVAKGTVDALFKVTEEKDYPFSITLCLDPMCGADTVATVKELLGKHGSSPKLARRGGKPLIFGYQSWCMSVGALYGHLPPGASKEQQPPLIDALRTTPAGWEVMGQAFEDAQRQVGQPVSYHYCLSSFFFNVAPEVMKAKQPNMIEAAGIIAKHVQAVGGFGWMGPEQPAIAKAVRAAGAEWSMPVGMYQKENIPYECYVPKGTDWMHWAPAALEQDATLLQLVTWNDYGENTNIAPAWNTRYTAYDLTGYHIAYWKTGRPPVPDHDRVYLTYRKYAAGAPVFPFHAKFTSVDEGALEVLTILPAPARIELQGRGIAFDAPAGFHKVQFPLAPGPVIADLSRDGKVQLHLESPEPITDRPFREDHAMVCWSSEDERLWAEDFPGKRPQWWSEYGDLDHDGLPNWFEMYWYGHFGDLRTATKADPEALTVGGKTLLEAYTEQLDPTLAPLDTLGEMLQSK